jgi:hypothetical protein
MLAAREPEGCLTLLATPQDRFEVFAEHEFFERLGLEPTPRLRRTSRKPRRTHRAAGLTVLAGAVGIFGGVVAFNCLRRSHTLRPGSPQGVTHVEPHAKLAATSNVFTRRPRHPHWTRRREASWRFSRSPSSAHAPALVVRRPRDLSGHRRSRLVAAQAMRQTGAVHEAASTALASSAGPVAGSRTYTHEGEFGFEH